MEQEIKFCTTNDAVNIAFSVVGDGPPFVKVANWLNHLELDWTSPVWSHWLAEFGRGQQLIRYDERGTGLSDRKVDDLSLDAFVDDLRSVVDAAGVDRFPLLAISQGGPVAIAYTVRYPEKVSHLILYGSFATGWKKGRLRDHEIEKRQAQLALIKQSWESRNPAIRQLFTTLCIPAGDSDEQASFNQLQRESVTGATAARIFDALGELDVADLLPQLKVPVIVLHSMHDAIVPFEDGRKTAAQIPNARFVPLESENHVLLRNEPAWLKFVTEVNAFLGREPARDETVVMGQLRRCPRCDRMYGGDTYFCLEDGARLLELDGEAKATADGDVTRIH